MKMNETEALELLEELKAIPERVKKIEDLVKEEGSLASLAQRLDTVKGQVGHDHATCPECVQGRKEYGERAGREVLRQIGAAASKAGLVKEADAVATAYQADAAGKLETPADIPEETPPEGSAGLVVDSLSIVP